MLLLLTGASGAGKSTVLSRLERVDWEQPVECAEFDSIGVPAGADTAWRHGAIEQWVGRALRSQEQDRHLLLCGQVPLGELLAAPSADRLEDVAVCMLACSPDERRTRLTARGEPEENLIHHVRFGEWFHQHTLDPTHLPEVIRVDSDVPMRWDRWATWAAGHPRWHADVIDTDDLDPDAVAARVEAWPSARWRVATPHPQALWRVGSLSA